MEHGHGQLDVAKVTWAGLHVFFARGAREHAVDAAEARVTETILEGLLLLVVESVRVDDIADGHGLDLLGREETELDLLDGAQRAF